MTVGKDVIERLEGFVEGCLIVDDDDPIAKDVSELLDAYKALTPRPFEEAKDFKTETLLFLDDRGGAACGFWNGFLNNWQFDEDEFNGQENKSWLRFVRVSALPPS